MPRRVAERAKTTHPDEQLVHAYLDALRHQRRLSPATLAAYCQALDVLCALAHDTRLEALDTARLRRFVALLHAQGLSGRTLAKTLSAWRGLYRWLVRHRRFRVNPVQGLRSPKSPRPLPKALSVEETEQLLAGGSEDEPAQLRDQAMFELMYSSGLRLAELVALDTDDGRLDLRQG